MILNQKIRGNQDTPSWFPLSHLLFGLRIWIAMVLALGFAFWFQLSGASSAATGVAILALPTRGQTSDKAVWRFAGSIIGVLASIIIAAAFNDLRTPFILAISTWIAFCVFAANMLDGNRAYAAVLSGYTVAIVAAANIDAPQDVFLSGMNRGAAIALAIVSVILVNDLFGTPNVLPRLIREIREIQAEVRAFALRMMDSEETDSVETAHLFGRITALRADALLLPTESVAGGLRAAAAKRAVANLVLELRAAFVFGSTLPDADGHKANWRDWITLVVKDSSTAERLFEYATGVISDVGATPSQLILAHGAKYFVKHDFVVTDDLNDIVSGRGSADSPSLQSYYSFNSAARNALRTFVMISVVASLLVMGGWPSSITVLVNFCALAGLSAVNSDPRSFATGTLIAMPLAAAISGVIEFMLLDGADSYPILAITLLPTVIASCLLVASKGPVLFNVGFILNVYTPILLNPTNPQSYDPQSYLINLFCNLIAAGLLAVCILVLLPTDDQRRRNWMLGAIRRELFESFKRHVDRPSLENASFRSAHRLGQLAGLGYADDDSRTATLSHALHLSEITFAIHWAFHMLTDCEGAAAAETRVALATLDPARLRIATQGLRSDPTLHSASAYLVRAAALMDLYAADLLLARTAAAP